MSETLKAWETVARHDVNKRAATLSLGHLIHIRDRVVKPVAKVAMKKGPANWVAATRLTGLVIIGKRMFTPAIMPAIPKVIFTSLITAPNVLLLAAANVGVDRLVHGLAASLRPHVTKPPVAMRISSVQDDLCLTKDGLGLGFTRCGAAGTDEWRFERTAPRVPLTRQAVLGLVHGADGTRFFAVAEPDPPGTWSPSPKFRLCADRWCARSVSRGADNLVSPAADNYTALARISRCSSNSSALVTQQLPPVGNSSLQPSSCMSSRFAMESCSLVLVPLKLLCAAAPEASAATAPGGASVATPGLLALLLLSPLLYLTLNTLLPTLLGTQAHRAGTPSPSRV